MRILIALTALMLAGCGASDHSRYYVLTETGGSRSRDCDVTGDDDRPRSHSIACRVGSTPSGSSSQLGRDLLFRI